jgi:hypothetical protein
MSDPMNRCVSTSTGPRDQSEIALVRLLSHCSHLCNIFMKTDVVEVVELMLGSLEGVVDTGLVTGAFREGGENALNVRVLGDL